MTFNFILLRPEITHGERLLLTFCLYPNTHEHDIISLCKNNGKHSPKIQLNSYKHVIFYNYPSKVLSTNLAKFGPFPPMNLSNYMYKA